MYESPYKPKFAVVLDFEPVAAHYYRLAGLGPLYLTASDGAKPDVALARPYASKANAIQAGKRAQRDLWGIRGFHVEQINPNANDGPPNVKVKN